MKIPTTTLVLGAVIALWVCALIVGVSVQMRRASDDDSATVSSPQLQVAQTPSTSVAPLPALCNYTSESAELVADDAGRLCSRDAPAWDAVTGCCVNASLSPCASCVASVNGSGDRFADFAASGGCCTLYEACVTCCVQSAFLVSSESRFAWCALKCRTSSASVDRTGHYVSDNVYCIRRIASALPTPSRRPRASAQTVSDAPLRASARPSLQPTLEMLEWRK
jgi:hypothetical protein